MTRRQVYFHNPKSGKYYVTSELPGCKAELGSDGKHGGLTCTKTWIEILSEFERVTSLLQFMETAARVESYYSIPIDVEVGTRIRTFNSAADIPCKDETYGIIQGISGVYLDERFSKV